MALNDSISQAVTRSASGIPTSSGNQSNFIDPSLRQAVNNIANTAMMETDPEAAIKKGLLTIEKPPEFSYGAPINEAIMKRARDKFYDPTISAGLQKLRYATNQADKLQNAANNILNVYKLDRQAEEIVRQRKAAEDSQRASVISSVLGLGGAVLGGVIAGPGGAVVGSQLGNMAGQQASGGTGYLGVNTSFGGK